MLPAFLYLIEEDGVNLKTKLVNCFLKILG
ncbi:MAG: hypothetical protein H6Q63_991 [Firmicutes bacterium]|nr:hypothetical protein [Bacillota bacterium]